MNILTSQDLIDHLSYRFDEICQKVECIRLSDLDLEFIQTEIFNTFKIHLSRNHILKLLKNLHNHEEFDRLVQVKLQNIYTNKNLVPVFEHLNYSIDRVSLSDSATACVLIRESIADRFNLKKYKYVPKNEDWLLKNLVSDYDDLDDYRFTSLDYLNKDMIANEIESNMTANEEDFMYKKLTHPSYLYSSMLIMADDFIEFFMKPYLKASARYIGDIRLNSYLDRFFNLHIDENDCKAISLYYEYYRGRKNITDFAITLNFRKPKTSLDLRQFVSSVYLKTHYDQIDNEVVSRQFNLENDDKVLQVDLLHEGIYARMSDIRRLKSNLDTRVKYLTKLAKLKYLDNDLDKIEQLTHEMHEIANRSFCISVNDLLQDDSFKDLDYLSVIKLADSSDRVKLLKTEDLEFLTESFCKTLYHEDALLEYRKIWNLELIVDSELYDTLKAAEVKFKENQSWKYDSRQRYESIALDDAIMFYLEKYEHSRSSSMLSAVSTIRSAYRMLIKDRSEDSNTEEIELALDLDLRNQFAQYINDNCSKLRLYVNSALRLEVA